MATARGGEWRVHSCSSESPVHKAENLLLPELYRIWQTNEPSEEAWLILQAHPPMPFHKLEIVNAGSSLIQVYGLSENQEKEEQEEEEEELLLSTQQVMTLKDLTNKSNRNRTFTYAIPQKLSPLAAQKRWKQLRILCRQPFGTSAHKACIGLSRVNVITEACASQSVETSMPQEVKKPCFGQEPTKSMGSDTFITSSTENQLMNDKGGKGDVKKRKLPSWNVTTEKCAEDSEEKILSSTGFNEQKKAKRISESSKGSGKDSTNDHTLNAGHSVNIPLRDEIKMNSSSPKTTANEKMQNKSISGKTHANKVMDSPSNRSVLCDSSAEGGDTGSSKSKSDVGFFAMLLDGVVFAISGLVNPERGILRSQALEMGADYQPDWNSQCTLLVCAFPNTPKFKQVKNDGGTIVSKEWVTDCYQQRKLVDIDRYLMHAGKPWRKMTPLNVSPVSVIVAGKESEQTGKESEQTKKKFSLGGRTVSARPNKKEKTIDAKTNQKTNFNTSEVKTWVVEDLNATVSWLQEQPEKPNPSELKETAIQGIEACLEDTAKCLEENKPVQTVLENWEFVPRVVKELATLEDCSKGSQKISREELCKRANVLKNIYKTEFVELRKLIQQNNGKVQTDSGGQSSEARDRSKEIDASMSDGDSDDTIVMGEDELNEAEAALSKKYSGT